MKFAICNELFEGSHFAEMVRFAAKTGYDGIEIAPFTLAETVREISAERRREIRRIISDAGMEITGLHWLLLKPEGLYINHSDPNIRAKTVAYLRELIDFCGDIGGKVMIFGSPNQRKVLPELSYETAWDYAVDGLRSCGATAAERGVTICMEALPSSLTDFLATNAEVIRFVNAVNHPHLRMMVDVKSMCSEAVSVPENIRACRDYFQYVHANDANMRGPGFGDVDYRPILRAFKEINYQGFISVEVFDFKPDPETIARESLRYMKACL